MMTTYSPVLAEQRIDELRKQAANERLADRIRRQRKGRRRSAAARAARAALSRPATAA